ncbi:hypothetical protein Sj15T_12580 [Sphingobium sp. TA15]|nr:hypothetical protein Sj15T_12580 [Sphingobium sp. TA15]
MHPALRHVTVRGDTHGLPKSAEEPTSAHLGIESKFVEVDRFPQIRFDMLRNPEHRLMVQSGRRVVVPLPLDPAKQMKHDASRQRLGIYWSGLGRTR